MIIVSTVISCVILLNIEYFEYLVDDTKKFQTRFELISGFVGGDSRFYYNLNDGIISIIYAGVISGGVEFGSILSLIGIYLYVSVSEVIFGSKLIGVVALNSLIGAPILRSLRLNTHRTSIMLLLMFPLTLNYLIVPNKEIFGLLLLTLFATETSIRQKIIYLTPIAIIRDSYAAQILWFTGAKVVGERMMLLIFFLILPFAIPANYFTESSLVENQASGSIVELANTFLQIPVLSFFGVMIKIAVGLFSGVVITSIDNLTIIKLQYFICANINLFFAAKILLSPSFRRHLLTDNKRYILSCVIYAFVMSLAPGNPARFLGPLTFMFLYKLITWKR